jgi:hypothetical protein
MECPRCKSDYFENNNQGFLECGLCGFKIKNLGLIKCGDCEARVHETFWVETKPDRFSILCGKCSKKYEETA